MVDTNEGTPDITPDITEEAPPKAKESFPSHGLRVRDPDWEVWQQITKLYPSAADAFSDLMNMAQMRAIGAKAGMSAKSDLVAEHARQITALFNDLLTTMQEQTSLATNRLEEAEKRYQEQIQEARNATSMAQEELEASHSIVASAQEAADNAKKAAMAVTEERDKLVQELAHVRQDLATSRDLCQQAISNEQSAHEEAQVLRDASDHAKSEIADLQAQLAAAKAALAEEQMARKMAEAEVTSLTARLKSKDDQLASQNRDKEDLISALRDHVASLKQQLAAANQVPVQPD